MPSKRMNNPKSGEKGGTPALKQKKERPNIGWGLRGVKSLRIISLGPKTEGQTGCRIAERKNGGK